MTSPGGVGAARGDAPTPQDAAAETLAEVIARTLTEHEPFGGGWYCTCQANDETGEFGVLVDGTWDAHLVAVLVAVLAAAAASPVPVAADVPTPSAATQNDGQR